jgi:trehalose/maltose hydrolase-like predicted phosphorylase
MSNIYELQTQVAYLDILKRYPTVNELSNNSSLLSSQQETPDQLRSSLQLTNEYLKTQGLFAGDTTFIDWTISASNLNDTNFNGINISNGKLCLVTNSTYNDVEKSFISTNFDYNNFGTYTQNITDVFKYTTISIFDRDQSTTTVSNLEQSLNMLTANFTTTYDIMNSNINPASNISINVSTELRALRNLPYCALNTITLLTNTTTNVDIYHDIIAPISIDKVRYNNNLINTTIGGSNTSLYFFQANGIIDELNKSVSTSCAYVFENSNFTNRGYNIDLSDTNIAFNKFNISLTSNVPTKLHILSSTMTELDFPKPDVETQRILINALTYTPNDLIQDHVKEWSKLWTGNIYITPKDMITSAENDAINTVNRFLRFSLYNIYTVVRDDVNVEINPLNISTIDLDGHIFWSGETWFLPVLTLLKPKAAKSLLDYRHYQLENAMKLAAAHGYKGSKYAYENDNSSYKNVYWNTISPLQIFNTGLISIAIWNYYRVARDTDWLSKKGYEILKNNADFFVSKLEYNAIDDTYNMYNVIGLDDTCGNNNALTNYVAKLALQYALEAKYELNYVYQVDWKMYISKIKIGVTANPSTNTTPDRGTNVYNIINTNDDNTPSILKILDALILLHPYYSKAFFDISQNYDTTTIKNNITSFTSRLDPIESNSAFNNLMLSTLWGTIAQQETTINNKTTAITNFNNNLLSLFANDTLIPWQTFFNSKYKKQYNDIGVSSMFLLNFLTSVIGLRIQGGIDEARFYYQEFGIVSKTSSVLPSTWKAIEIYGVGGEISDQHYCVTNSMIYTPTP